MLRPKEDEISQSRPFRPARVGVVGSGIAAHLTALALKEWRPELEVVLVTEPTPPALGAGVVSSTPALVPFLFGLLGIDPVRFVRAVAPTFKLGTHYAWGRGQSGFVVPYGDADDVDAQAHDGYVARSSVAAQLIAAGKAPFARVGERTIPLLRDVRFGFHADEGRLVRFLAARADAVGVERVPVGLGAVELDEGKGVVARALGRDGRVLRFDLWVDCSGRAGVLIEGALGVPFESFAGSVVSDALVMGRRVSAKGAVAGDGGARSHTEAGTAEAGWSWRVPLRDGEHVGYVYDTRFATPEAAERELAARFGEVQAVRHARYRVGRRQTFVSGNVVAIGDAYGIVDPLVTGAGLELTLMMIDRLLALVGSAGQDLRKLDAQIAAHWERVRWLTALVYRFNRRVESPYWRHVHMTTDWSGMEDLVRDFLARGPRRARDAARPSELGHVPTSEIELTLLGLGVVPERLEPKTSAAEWRELASMREAIVACALREADTWPLLDDAALWSASVHADGSWCRAHTQELVRATPMRGRSQDALAFLTKELGVPAVLGRDAAKLADEFPTSPNIDFGKFMKKVPELVLRTRDQAQLAECLQLCARRHMPIHVRGAAHSSGGQTLADEGAVIDLRWLKRIVAETHDDAREARHVARSGSGDGRDGRIRVEAGVWWLELCGHLHAQGRRPLVLTDNWRSTVAGTLAVGGFGDASHREGLQIAGVRELTVMTLDGTRHRTKPGDDLFDWSLAGRGQLGVITEVVLDTIERGYRLEARVLEWPTLAAFVADARVIVAERRFDWLRARLRYEEGAPVGAAAGHLGDEAAIAARREACARDFAGLAARQSANEIVELFDKSAEPPDARWALASPSVEIVVPADEAGVGALEEIVRRVRTSGLARHLPRGSSIMPLAGMAAHDARAPLAPLPTGPLALMLAIRPEVPLAEVPRYLTMLRSFADLALDAGGKIYLMGLEPTRAGWLATQVGAARLERWTALKAKWDPYGLLNPGLLPTR